MNSKKSIYSASAGPSLFSLAIVFGAISLSIAEAIPGGLDGAWGFILGSAVSFILLTVIWASAAKRTNKTDLVPRSEEQMSELAVAVYGVLSKLSKGTGRAEWK